MGTAVKWEYLTAILANDTNRDRVILNNYGNLGWELVSVDNGIAYFKRPLKPKSENELLYEIDRGRASLV